MAPAVLILTLVTGASAGVSQSVEQSAPANTGPGDFPGGEIRGLLRDKHE